MLKKTGSQTYLCDEVGVRQEELFHYVENSENGGQLVLQSQFGNFGDRRGLLAFGAGALDLVVNTGSTGLRVRRGERQDSPEERWETGEEFSWPVGVAEEGTGGEHCVGKHPCGGLTFAIRLYKLKAEFKVSTATRESVFNDDSPMLKS